MRIAVLCSAHGFGHVTRQLAVAEHLTALGAAPTFFTAAPASILRETLPELSIRPWVMDVGVVQPDGIHHDAAATLARLASVCSEAAIDALAEAVSGFDRAVVDVAPAGLEACRRAGVPALAVGNFDWAWIYRRYPALQGWADRFADWQAPHPAVALTPGPGLRGFASVETLGVVARRRPARRVVGSRERGVLVSFGGHAEMPLRLPSIPGVRYILSAPMPRLERPDCVYVEDVAYPSLVAGADAVLSKPGYGILAEACLAGTPLVWVDRSGWPESPSLEAAMWARGDVKIEGPVARGLPRALRRVWGRGRPAVVPDFSARVLAVRCLDRGFVG